MKRERESNKNKLKRKIKINFSSLVKIHNKHNTEEDVYEGTIINDQTPDEDMARLEDFVKHSAAFDDHKTLVEHFTGSFAMMYSSIMYIKYRVSPRIEAIYLAGLMNRIDAVDQILKNYPVTK